MSYPIGCNFFQRENIPSKFREFLEKLTSLIVCEFEDNILNFRKVMNFYVVAVDYLIRDPSN